MKTKNFKRLNAKSLVRLRKENDLLQRELAAMLGLHTNHYQRFEYGRKIPEATQMAIRALLGDNDD